MADKPGKNLPGILREHPTGGSEQLFPGGLECLQVVGVTTDTLIHRCEEFEVNDVLAVGKIDDEMLAEVAPREAGSESLGQTRLQLIRRSGIEPVRIQAQFTGNLCRGSLERLRHRTGIDEADPRIHSCHDVHVPCGSGDEPQRQQGRSAG